MVKPDITGWAWVNGRNAISWEEKFEFHVWYVDHVNLKTVIKILFKNIEKVFNREGISVSEGDTMTMFTGTTNKIKKIKLSLCHLANHGE